MSEKYLCYSDLERPQFLPYLLTTSLSMYQLRTIVTPSWTFNGKYFSFTSPKHSYRVLARYSRPCQKSIPTKMIDLFYCFKFAQIWKQIPFHIAKISNFLSLIVNFLPSDAIFVNNAVKLSNENVKPFEAWQLLTPGVYIWTSNLCIVISDENIMWNHVYTSPINSINPPNIKKSNIRKKRIRR